MATRGTGRPRFNELTGPDAAIADGEAPATAGDVPSAAQAQDRVVPDRLVGLLDPELRGLCHETDGTECSARATGALAASSVAEPVPAVPIPESSVERHGRIEVELRQ